LDCLGVQEAAVVGIPDDIREESIVAFVVGESVDLTPVVEHCRTHLAAYKQPQHVLGIDALPLNAIGKVDKVELRRRAIRLLVETP
jgi:acyl-coenzyme A synthetase/AMP-(fatty) acid ligase